MNFFILIKNEKGEQELLTANLDGTILPGVTRQSIIDLSKEWGVKVSERPISIHEIIKCYKEKRIIESFCSGTAAVVVPIREITYKGEKITLLDEQKEIGEYTKKVHDSILDIQYGVVKHPWQDKI